MKFEFEVTQTITIELDERAFTEEFMAEFRKSFFSFYEIEEHAEHIAQLQARGVIDLEGWGSGSTFIEGYGPAEDFGIKAKSGNLDVYQIGPIT